MRGVGMVERNRDWVGNMNKGALTGLQRSVECAPCPYRAYVRCHDSSVIPRLQHSVFNNKYQIFIILYSVLR